EDRFDYEARYEIGRTDYRCPARLGDEGAAVAGVAGRTWEALRCEGFVNVDLILDPEAGPQVLEVNAVPGLTDTSLFPMAAEAAGIDFTQLVERILASARERPAAETTLPA